MVGLHFLFLHESGSNSPLGAGVNVDKIYFHPYYSEKDILGLTFALLLGLGVVLIFPNLFGDPENFLPANVLVTPAHIQPEWYFLFAYAILRAIPNKLGGVVALLLAILILAILPFLPRGQFRGLPFYPPGKLLFWALISIFFLLTYIGAQPVEAPFILLGQLLRVLYFRYFLLAWGLNSLWDVLLAK